MNKTDIMGPRISKNQLNNLNYVDLWKYFEGRGSEVKATMFKVVTWILGFAALILGYIIKEYSTINSNNETSAHLWGILFLGAIGIAIAYYAKIVINDFGDHINRNFDRADASREGNLSLDEIWEAGETSHIFRKDLPAICKTLLHVSYGFLLAFVLSIILAILLILKNFLIAQILELR